MAPVGWHTKSSPSVNTRRLLVEHGGFLYDSDAYNDNLPYDVAVNERPHPVLPYAFASHDMRCFGDQAFVRGSDVTDYVIDSCDWLLQESRHRPKRMSIGLHLRFIGRAGRIAGLQTVLAPMRQRGGTSVARRDAIARHWLDTQPPPA